jgi:hypothetical protein
MEAIEASSTLGWMLLALDGSLAERDASRLQRTVQRARTSLRVAGEFRRYINGNYAIPLCELAYLSRHLGGTESGDDSYERCWRLLVEPASVNPRWDGYGWVESVAPSGDDFRGEEGYFTETPGYQGRFPRDTFDPQYAQLQLERLARLWLLSGDPRALRYLAAIHRLLLTELDMVRWTIGSIDGSRTTGLTPFFTPATCLLALHAPGAKIDPQFALAQFRHGVLSEYRRNGREPDPYRLRGYGTILVPLLLASAPQAPDGTVLTQSKTILGWVAQQS